MRKHAPIPAASIVLAALLLTGCTTSSATSGAPTDFGHVHGIVDLGNDAVLLGTHTGLFAVTATGAVTGPVGGVDFDAMSLTAAGDTLYASGHPGPATPAELGEHNLGIICSTDGGTTWEPVAFTGQEDFHVLTAGNGAIHAIATGSITIRTSLDDGASWIDSADLAAADLTVATDGRLWAATRDGVRESRDAGATFDPVQGTPLVYLLEATPAAGLVGVGTDGILWHSSDAASWTSIGTVIGTAQALGTTADGAVVLVDDRGLVWVRGSEATVVLPSGRTP